MAGRYEIDMCNGSLFPKIMRCALPMMFTNILQLLYNAVDIIVVGRYVGETALAAVGSTSPIINLIINLLIGLSIGTSIVTSQYVGAKNHTKTYDTVHTSLCVAVIGGIIFSAIGFFLSKPMLVLTDTPNNVINQASVYMKIYFLGTPALMVGNFGSAILRSVGDTKRPLYIFSASGVLNAVLNLVFVIFFNMDVAGVALATIISQYISATFIIVAMTKTDGFVTLYIKELRIKKDVFLEILKKGLPVGIQSVIFSSSNIIIQSSVNSFGSAVMAGCSAAANIESFLYTALNTFCHIATTFVGQNYGAKKYKRIDKTLIICLVMVIFIGVSISLLILPFERFLLSIYAPGNEGAISNGVIRFRYIFHVYFLCGTMEVLVGTIRGLGKTLMPMIVSVFGVVVVRIAWIYTVFYRIKTLESLYMCYPVSWLVSIFVLIGCYFVVRKRLFKKEEGL